MESAPMAKASLAATTPAPNADIVRWSAEGGAYTLRFRGELTGEPVLSRLCRRFNVEVNIRAGGVQNVGDVAVGTLIADITGEETEVDGALAYLAHSGVTVEKNK
jgi:D-methionine transport system ATP-binding protein